MLNHCQCTRTPLSTPHWRAARALLAAATVLAFAACGGGGNDTVATSTTVVAPACKPTAVASCVGAAGGVVYGPNGSSVNIPAGALAVDTAVTILQGGADSPALPVGGGLVGTVWQLLPHGTTFAKPVTLTLPLDASALATGTVPRLYKAQPGAAYAEVTPITVNGNAISAQVTSFSFLAVITNKPPTAVLTLPSGSALSGQALSFSASGSSDPEGPIASYRWEFGDGSAAQEGPGLTTVTHSFSAAGSFAVSLTVTDALGTTHTAAASVGITPPDPTCIAPQVLSGHVCITPNQAPVARIVASTTTPVAGAAVTLDPSTSSDADGSIVSYRWSFSDGSATITTSTPAVQSKSWPSAGSQTVYLTVTDNQGATHDSSRVLTVGAPPAGLLTDTGITASQCYAAGSDVLLSCTSAGAIALNPSQDGMVGRDVATPASADGKLGFSYSVVGSYPVTDCVKDNITGLTWEGKTATGTRAGSNTYTNYDNTAAAQYWSGSAYVNPTLLQVSAATNAVGYKNAVNALALCGYNDWRLPTADELQSLVDYGVASPGPTVDATWLPNTPGNAYWTATPVVGDASVAWGLGFSHGYVYGYGRGNSYLVRLVR